MSDLLFHKTAQPFPAEDIPEVIIDAEPEFSEFYDLAWKLAWEHVYESDDMPFSPYLSEGCGINKVWIWDSCFMGMFCRYALNSFPGRATLDNLYALLYHPEVPIRIHHLDNPPLFAWIEWMYYQMDSDKERLTEVLPKLIYHYDFLEQLDPAAYDNFDLPSITWKKESGGYCWSGCPSGMDNTPRGRDDYKSIWWVDALSQQALSAHYIAKIADTLGDNKTKQRFTAEFEDKKTLLQNYWDEDTGAFLDIYRNGSGFCNVLTPASFWPAFAYCATVEQRKRLFSLLDDPGKLGGLVPFPSVSRDDPAFDPKGCYWRGAVWLPTAYMTVKTLEQFEEYGKAAELSLKLLRHMVKTWKEYEPHTIWECYSPTEAKPANSKIKPVVRKDFCGWSALGPISLLIENIIGISNFDANAKILTWNPGISCGRLGVRNLNFAGGKIDLIREDDTIRIRCEFPMTVYYKKQKLDCKKGENIFSVI
jgi:glycogen debranching enzyme